ncbi:lanthionine synthetase C family protein [Streptomyces cocklensis]|uniref:Lanthionine synthetase C-like protein n=1 Tax=Actinacidiphila cocklensis TaxID=887465 RepID=A0A9W4DPW9_9ACTN|nr:lanthionine synthetase C family protein [Actinacidiphila cocklensis]MDD1062837.1 lanthionine synthetase C family protein [Actinacidiphila cocklensis]CAG6394091.1 Lanthionine synthetase C-like protein [Actinacidiphila cocklensis]
MTAVTTSAAETVLHVARHLTEPAPPHPAEPWAVQSLADGVAGTALLHIEAARSHAQPWSTAHRWISAAVSGQVSAADTTGLFLGVPAIGFLLSTPPPEFDHLYGQARHTVHQHILTLAHRRIDAARARIHRGDLPTFAEYDLFYGLTGIGAYLLRTSPEDVALDRILRYLVALTRPLAPGAGGLPGWWVAHDPRRGHSPRFPGGHANLGAAHGITGPLLLLAQALRHGIEVNGHRDAIRTICEHLDTWRRDTETGPWWPEHLSRRDLEQRHPHRPHAARPSWCYGTPGIARAGQLAGIALRDTDLQALYEDALYLALSDPAQLAKITDTGLCHGWAGIYQIAARAAADASDPRLRGLLPTLGDALLGHTRYEPTAAPGLLNGAAGTALALSTLATQQPPSTGWDACLLIN